MFDAVVSIPLTSVTNNSCHSLEYVIKLMCFKLHFKKQILSTLFKQKLVHQKIQQLNSPMFTSAWEVTRWKRDKEAIVLLRSNVDSVHGRVLGLVLHADCSRAHINVLPCKNVVLMEDR